MDPVQGRVEIRDRAQPQENLRLAVILDVMESPGAVVRRGELPDLLFRLPQGRSPRVLTHMRFAAGHAPRAVGALLEQEPPLAVLRSEANTISFPSGDHKGVSTRGIAESKLQSGVSFRVVNPELMMGTRMFSELPVCRRETTTESRSGRDRLPSQVPCRPC